MADGTQGTATSVAEALAARLAAGGGSRGSRGNAAASRRQDASTAKGLPLFCRQRHFVKGANVYAVPLWDLTSRWLPEEIKQSGIAVQTNTVASSSSVPARQMETKGSTESGNDPEDDNAKAFVSSPDIATCRDPEEEESDGASDSEHSEIGWDGPLGGEYRVWSRATVEGGLILMRRIQGAPSSTGDESENTASQEPGYGLGLSSALFAQESLSSAADAILDRRMVEVLRGAREPRFAVCALRSGHFAGAVFHGPEPVVHKAIHRYTVRAKAGGSQSSADSGGRKIKSAGSSLRRYGEQRLAEEIRDLMLDKWAPELASCELVFVSVSKRMRATLLGTEKEPFVPQNKVRRLPFMVGKPTFEAVKEAHLKVASVIFADQKTTEKLTERFRPAPAKEASSPGLLVEPSKQKELPAVTQAKPEPVITYREEDDELFTPLHAAAAAGHEAKITELLDNGADPTARDGKGRVPYYLCSNQKAREAMRRWRGANEEAWDWHTSSVPEAITEESEQRKRDKEKEKKKKLKEKQKANKAKAREEEDEKRRKEEEEAKALEAAQAKCDNCQKPLVGKPFTRLNFLYCSTDCVNAHRRELQAEAAMKRLGGGT